MEYLRRIRLDHAHLDLAAAEPEVEMMTAVAYRWGLPSPMPSAIYCRQVHAEVFTCVADGQPLTSEQTGSRTCGHALRDA
jgi:hypothetical protein